MQRSVATVRTPARYGFTLIELILVIVALGVVAAFLLPSVRTARVSARRLQCLNNLKNLGLAVTNYATTFDGRLPGLTAPAPGMAAHVNATWALCLLPFLDRADTHEFIGQATTRPDAERAVQQVLALNFTFFQCPEDHHHFKQPGGLTYAPNIGYGPWHGNPDGVDLHYDFGANDHSLASVDWNNNGKLDVTDQQVARATGVFWMPGTKVLPLTFDELSDADGGGSTLLLMESLTLPLMHQAGPKKNGLNPAATECGVGLGIESLRLKKGSPPSLAVTLATRQTDEFLKYFSPNAPQRVEPVHTLSASSGHSRQVNVCFADGHVGSINEDIDWTVWARLHSPDGMRYGQAGLSEPAH